jgi:manganese/zinc/iron transport system substrate-binding protein
LIKKLSAVKLCENVGIGAGVFSREGLQIVKVRLLLLAVVACASCTPQADGGHSLRATATIGMIADVAEVVGKPHVTVTGLMGPGVDPHLYKATSSDLRKLREADVILYNGLHLEGRMADVLVKLARQVPAVQVTETIPEDLLREPAAFDGQYDPHVWFDLSMWRYVVEHIRDTFIGMDPANEETYRANAAQYLEKLDALHGYAKEQIASIPETSRVLVTAHDAFGYFGEAYDIEVMGIQGISTASEYGLQDLSRLVDVLVDRKVKAVFVESSVSSKSIEALVRGAESKGHKVRIGGELFSDAMGQAGTPEGTYLGMVRHNVDTIVAALK